MATQATPATQATRATPATPATRDLDSRVAAVTVYRAGARVERVADLPADGSGAREVRIEGLPLALDDATVRARVERARPGDDGALPVASDLRIALEVPRAPEPPSPDLEGKVRAARRAETTVSERIGRLQEEIERIEGLPAPSRPQGRPGRPPPASPAAAREALERFREEEVSRLVAERRALEENLRDATRERERLESIASLASSSRKLREHELRKCAVVTLEGGGAVPARLVLEYLVPGARWAPAYRVQLDREFTRARLSLRAVVAQRSGEDWDGVRLTLSTAEAMRWVEMPDMASIRIGRRQPPPRKTGWRPPPEGAEELFADHDAAFGEAPVPPGPAGVEQEAPEPPSDSSLDTSKDSRDDDALAAPLEVMDEKTVREEPVGERARRVTGRPPPPPPVPKPALRTAPPAGMAQVASYAPAPAGPRAAEKSKKVGALLKREARAPEEAAGELEAERRDSGFGSGAGGAVPGADLGEAPPEPEPSGGAPGDDLLEYGRLRMADPDRPERGELRPLSRERLYIEALPEGARPRRKEVARAIASGVREARAVESLAPPPGCFLEPDPEGYDHAYLADGPVSVPSDGTWHAIPLATREGPLSMRHVTVPRESPEVFRYAEAQNPLGAPLLAGPADVLVGGDYLLTAPLRATPAGGILRLGLGLESAVKVARNIRFAEEAAGVLGGTTNLRHEISVEVSNGLPRPALVEVRERVPVPKEGEDHLKIAVGAVEPPWETYDPDDHALKGGHRWLVTVEPGKPRTLRATYTVQIPSKQELSGGNRRD
ncbi:MAG: DUF4139 domain-containing protein [Planctomycetales bacterium]|nr:DUF4139 domain-containing protein [Planctomycetales bacterium]